MPENITLEQRKERFEKSVAFKKPRIVICAGTGCVAGGSLKIYEHFCEELAKRNLKIPVELESEQGDYSIAQSGCQGFCQMGPLVTLKPKGILYVKVSPDDVAEIVEKTLINGEYIDRLLYTSPDHGAPVRDMNKIPFYSRQHRLTLGLCGNIDVKNLDEYIYHGGYFVARKTEKQMGDKENFGMILASGL
ncbi:(2Fe-2S) ferredoxin domain-containing protein [Treponema sp. R6D11]